MKYTNTMRKLLFTFSFIILGSSAIAQPTINSPYSSFGIGELGGLDHATMLGMGNSTITAIDSFTVNYFNPASYNQLAAGQPLFSLGISSRLSNYSSGSESSFSNVTALQHFAMAFPIRKNFGLAFGLKPYSRKGYEVTTRSLLGSDSLKYTYSGSGGFNDVFIGLSGDLLAPFKLDSTSLSIGANFGYLFGEATDLRSSTLTASGSDFTGGIDLTTIQASSFHYNLGLSLSHDFRQGDSSKFQHALLLSATLEPSQNLRATSEYGRYYSINVNDPAFYDTLFYQKYDADRIVSAADLAIGLRYTLNRPSKKNDKHRLNSQLAVHATYRSTNWTNFSIPFDGDSTQYLATTGFNFGLQYIPEVGFLSNRTLTKFHERMRYRVGAYYNTLPYTAGGEQVTDFGTTFGLGLPIAVRSSVSSVNFGFSFGQRGVSDASQLKEQYYGINFGITISPVGDRWFQKRKLD